MFRQDRKTERKDEKLSELFNVKTNLNSLKLTDLIWKVQQNNNLDDTFKSCCNNPLSHPNDFYWGHQCSWTLSPANSIQVSNMQS